MFGLVTWTVRRTSASKRGKLSFRDVKFIDIRWNVGSLGFADIRAVVATADAAPIIAELQLHFTFLPIPTQQQGVSDWRREESQG